jgi:hypothetical protein
MTRGGAAPRKGLSLKDLRPLRKDKLAIAPEANLLDDTGEGIVPLETGRERSTASASILGRLGEPSVNDLPDTRSVPRTNKVLNNFVFEHVII